jgi:serine/threonine protein kinase
VGYESAVASLAGLSEEEFLSITECRQAEAVLCQRQFSKIETKYHSWLYDLCRDISTKSPGRPWPRYIPKYALARGGMALLFVVVDQWSQQEVVLKIPIPAAAHDGGGAKLQDPETTEPPKILRGGAKLREVAQRMFRRLEPPQKKKEQSEVAEFPRLTPAELAEEKKRLDELRRSSYYDRVRDSFVVQEQLHRRGCKVDPDRKLGYVPKTFEFGFHPKCYFTQELILGDDYFTWIYGHNDEEIFDLFLRLVIFVEKVFHEIKVYHCDLNPTNIKVVEGVPVILDYGIVKSPVLTPKTLDYAQMGTWGYSSPDQLRDAKQRGALDDIFSLGRILHVTLTRTQPALAVVAEEDERGRQWVDENLIAAFYPAEVLPDRYRGIFKKTQGGDYASIAGLRADLEGTIFGRETQTISGCIEPCEELLRLKAILVKFLEEIKDV